MSWIQITLTIAFIIWMFAMLLIGWLIWRATVAHAERMEAVLAQTALRLSETAHKLAEAVPPPGKSAP